MQPEFYEMLNTNKGDKANYSLLLPLKQLLAYFIIRHTSNAYDLRDLYSKTAFSLLSFRLIVSVFSASDNQNIQNLIDVARCYSAEIEYSSNNLNKILDTLDGMVKI